MAKHVLWIPRGLSVGARKIERMFETGAPTPALAQIDEAARPRCADEMAAAALAQGPGATSVSLLTALPRKQLTDGGRLDNIRAWEQVASWALAQQLPAIATHVGPEPITGTANNRSENLAFLEQQAAIEEVRLTLALSPPATKDRVEVAQHLCGPMHQSFAELSSGRMTYQHALAAVDAVRVLDPERVADVGQIEARAIQRAGHKPVGDFRRALRSAVDTTDPTAAMRRHRRAKSERGVRRWPLPNGMACLSVEAPGPDIEVIYGALSVLAGKAAPDDDRSIDARRCDALLALCLGAVAPAPAPGDNQSESTSGPLRARPKVPVQAHVVIDVATLLGLADNNCTLSGYGEIPAGLAREWLHEATTWRRLVTDPISGHLLDFGPQVRIARESCVGSWPRDTNPAPSRHAIAALEMPTWTTNRSGRLAARVALPPAGKCGRCAAAITTSRLSPVGAVTTSSVASPLRSAVLALVKTMVGRSGEDRRADNGTCRHRRSLTTTDH